MVDVILNKIKKQNDDLEKDIQAIQEKMDVEMK